MEVGSGFVRCRLLRCSLDGAVFHLLIHPSGESNFDWPSKDRMGAGVHLIRKLLGKVFQECDAPLNQ